ncbi:amidohydrolase [Occallatibacter riparius]|uniref:Amidohydrolase family protein n=1 Tax=Occallatibacter riparius TaxID=1002689 RepID=A0A9J7BLD7_9BACT|nr:amidohydrolase family protein [Occallatibacter riparius]UWZ83459.1 amidohydrolase family protein [Occallatibacter riparius]
MRAHILLALGLALPSLAFSQTRSQHRDSGHAGAAQKQSIAPDVIYFNAVIYTGEGLAEDKPQVVQAMAIGGGKVLAVGTTDEITRMAGPKTKLRDLASAKTGHCIFPGFNDAHVHLGGAGQTKLNVDLTGAQSLGEMLAKVQKFAQEASLGHWLIGGNWDHTLWADKVLPTRQDLDKVTGDHPAFLDRIDGHIAIANTAALKAAGITGKTKAPEGGAIDLDANGEPTGILRESAKELVVKVIPPPTHEERRRGDELAIADALAHGITSVQDFSEWDDFLVYEEMEKEGKLNIRISEWLPFRLPLDDLKRMMAHHDQHDPMLHTGMLKGFMDGSLGSHTAALKAPYADESGNSGLPQFTQEELNKLAVERAKAGFQMGFHAIGDRGTAMALEAYQRSCEELTAIATNDKVTRMVPRCSLALAQKPRNRIEHAQVVDPVDIPRFKQLGVIASMQPNHLLTDMNWAEERLGPQRAAYSYAWKAFLDAGVPLAFGTDYPVEPITPFRGLYAAVTRMNEAGTKSYYPESKLARGQALYAYTQGSAYAEFAEQHKGKLEPGYDADFVVVDRNLDEVPAAEILKAKVLGTFVGGRAAYPPVH